MLSVAEASPAEFVVFFVSDFAFDFDLLVPSRDALALAFVEVNGSARAVAVRDFAALGIVDAFGQSYHLKIRLMQGDSSVQFIQETHHWNA